MGGWVGGHFSTGLTEITTFEQRHEGDGGEPCRYLGEYSKETPWAGSGCAVSVEQRGVRML